MTAVATGNLYHDVPPTLSQEQVCRLLATPDLRIERIVSTGQESPPDFWYDQDWAEWVLVLAGTAGLLIEGEAAPRRLERGSFVHLGPHVRHRVAWTDPAVPTVWLVIHHR